MTPLVSIIIPAYNAEEFLAETISSALRQTWPRKEIIVVDDGSRDATLAIARRFAAREVRIVTQPNQGAAAARNHGLSLCQGDYVQWLDADDLLASDKIAKQMADCERVPDSRRLLSCGWGRFMHRPSRASFVATTLWNDLSPVEWLIRKLSQNVYMQTATWLVSRELTNAAGPWDTRLLGDDDGEYFCRVLLASHGTRFIPDARVFYRTAGPGSLSYMGRSDPKVEAFFLSMCLHIHHLQSAENTERVRAACVMYLQAGLPFFYPERIDIVSRAERMAADLGGRLSVPPPVPWKYAWIEKGFGWPVTKRLQLFMPRCKWSILRAWDAAVSRFDHRDGR